MNRAACTIISPNYIAFARTLAASYLVQHPDDQFFVLIVANPANLAAETFADEAFTAVFLPEISLPNLCATAMQYSLLELNTSVKPSFLKHLLAGYTLDQLVYLDPDIFVYAPLKPVFDVLDDGATAVLTPHLLAPNFEIGPFLKEQDLLVNGTFNLGFLGLRRSRETDSLLVWWETRCLALGFSEGRTGLFVDQKWMNLAPAFFPGMYILRDPGCNMAYWNLQERTLRNGHVYSPVSEPVPLRFFHFSGIDFQNPAIISRHHDHLRIADRPDIQALFMDYRNTVLADRKPGVEMLPYGFDTFSDGTAITLLARRTFAKHQRHFADADPFGANGAFAHFAKFHHLVDGPAAPARDTWKQFDPLSFRVTALHMLLKFSLWLMGPHKYELIMRYLSHITVLRNQSVFLRDPNWPIGGAGN